MTTAKAIQALAPKLRALRAKGYTLEAIAAMLSQKGLTITTGTLRATLRRAGSTRGRGRPRAAKTPAQQS